MDLIFLGTSAGTPTRRRNVSSCALRRDDGEVWLFDCGEGTQHQILRSSIKPAAIEHLFLTHLHGDHCYGCFGLVSSLAVHGRGKRPFTIHGPRGIAAMMKAVLDLSYAQLPFPIIYEEWDEPGGELHYGGWTVQARPMVHRTPCFGYVVTEPQLPGRLNAQRVEALGVPGPLRGLLVRGEAVTLADGTRVEPQEVVGPSRAGRKVVILGDTRDTSAIAAAGHGCDVLVHEATFSADLHSKAIQWGHSTTAMAGASAQAMAARHLILTHFSSRYADHGPEWQDTAKVLCAEANEHCPQTMVHAAQDLHIATLSRSEERSLAWARDNHDSAAEEH